MRAVFHKEKLAIGSVISLKDESAHHLNVVRAKINEEILVLNGMGEKAHATIVSMNKKSVELSINSIQTDEQKHSIELAIANPKKDAFEDIIKIAVELGIRKIYPLSSKYSQFEYQKTDRIDRLIESALIQSNNLFWPEIKEQVALADFLKDINSPLIYFSSRPLNNKVQLNSEQKIVILVGPEGGFSLEEEAEILSVSNVNQIHLPTPIMRAPTAVATSVGYLLASLK